MAERRIPESKIKQENGMKTAERKIPESKIQVTSPKLK